MLCKNIYIKLLFRIKNCLYKRANLRQYKSKIGSEGSSLPYAYQVYFPVFPANCHFHLSFTAYIIKHGLKLN